MNVSDVFIADNTVDFYFFSWKEHVDKIERLYALLDLEEMNKVNSYRRILDKERYVVCRSFLKLILSYYLPVEPENIAISYNEYGKPFLGGSDITFNYSHSGEYIIYAFAREKEVGVDLEFYSPKKNIKSLVQRYFSDADCAVLKENNFQEELFFDFWTRKEAVLKAFGCGLRIALNSFDVSGSVVRIPPDNASFYLRQIPLTSSCKATVALQGQEDFIVNDNMACFVLFLDKTMP